MMKQFPFALVFLILLNECNKPAPLSETMSNAHLQDSTVYETETLIVKKLTNHVYQHITFLNTQSFGRVPCNGMIVISGNEAVVFDTPADDSGSSELLDLIFNKLNAKVTHYACCQDSSFFSLILSSNDNSGIIVSAKL